MSKAKTKTAQSVSNNKGEGQLNDRKKEMLLRNLTALHRHNAKMTGKLVSLWEVITMTGNELKLSDRLREMISANTSSQSSLKDFLKHEYEMPKSAFEAINNVLKIKQGDWANILGVPLSRIQSGSRFNHLQSMHILSVFLLYNNGIEVFGNRKKFEKWLDTKNEYYEDLLPKHYLRTPTGINILFDDLVKIEYGFVA